MTGREGFVGVSALLMPGVPAMHRAFVQIPGSALRMGMASFHEAIEQSRDLRRHCLRYAGMLLIQTAQTADPDRADGGLQRAPRCGRAARALAADEP